MKDIEVDGSTFYLNVQASILWNAHPYRTHPAFCGGLFEENSVFGNNIGFVLMGSCHAQAGRSGIYESSCSRVLMKPTREDSRLED